MQTQFEIQILIFGGVTRVNETHGVYVVILEQSRGGPIEFKVTVCRNGEIYWNVGRYLMSDKPCVRVSDRFGRRLLDALGLLEGED